MCPESSRHIFSLYLYLYIYISHYIPILVPKNHLDIYSFPTPWSAGSRSPNVCSSLWIWTSLSARPSPLRPESCDGVAAVQGRANEFSWWCFRRIRHLGSFIHLYTINSHIFIHPLSFTVIYCHLYIYWHYLYPIIPSIHIWSYHFHPIIINAHIHAFSLITNHQTFPNVLTTTIHH